jgi:alpha-N-arabinofuranosidase
LEIEITPDPAIFPDLTQGIFRVITIGSNTILIDQISVMPKSWLANGGFRPDLLNAIADIKPPVVRWPGGCFASAYRWKDGIGPQEKRQAYPFSIWDDRDVNSFGTDEFIAMCRRTGSEPLIVINIGTPGWNARRTPESVGIDWVQEACDWLEYCNGPATSKWGKLRAENGHPEPYNVKYWEIDNEIESPVEEYIAALKKFIPALKKIDPSIKIIACGSWRGNRERWDNTLVNEVGELFDYLSFHQYDDPNTFKDGPGKLERYFLSLGEVIKNSPNKHIRVFDSEWNAQSTDWRTGLYCGGMLNVFERCGDVVEMAAPALFLRHNVATAWDNAFINFDNKSWYPAPNYVVMKLWREHYAPIRIGIVGDAKGLNVVATKSEDGKTLYLKAVNSTLESCSVTLNTGSDVTDAALKLVTTGSLNARKPQRHRPKRRRSPTQRPNRAI